MSETDTTDQQAEELDLATVTPGDSPSENYLVVEHLQKMPNIFARGLVYVTVLLLVVAVTYACLASIDIVAECLAVARPESHKVKVLCDREGYVERVLVAEGQEVEAEAPLFVVRCKETVNYRAKVEELKQTIPLKEQHFEVRVAIARDKLKLRDEEHRNTLQVLEIKLDQTKIFLDSVKVEEEYWRKEVKIQQDEQERLQKLHAQGITSASELAAAGSKVERARTEVKKLMAQRENYLKQQTIHEEEKAREHTSWGMDKSLLEKEIKSLEIERKTTLGELGHELAVAEKMLLIREGEDAKPPSGETYNVIRSEMAGTVSEIGFRNPGDYVTQGALLCTLVPAGAPLYMDVTVANKDIGFIEVDTEVKYKFDAFPYSDHGALAGRVTAISPSAVEDQAGGFVYHVRGSLDKTHFTIKEKQHPLKPGMTAKAELVTEKKTIMSLLIKKFKD